MARQGLSRGDLLLLAAVLSAAGAAVAAYLAYEKLAAFTSSFCDINSYWSCSAVGGSGYAAIGPVPTAAIGLAGFLVLLGLALLAFQGREQIGPWSVANWILMFAGLGALIGLGLTFLEVFVIEAICILCVTGFVLDLGVLAIALALRRRS